MSSNSDTIFSSKNNSAGRFTPRELIKYHIEHPEIPITDKDIENLIINNSADSSLREEYQVLNKENGTNYINSNNNLNRPMSL